jgi:hypothetical protein
VLAPDRFSTSGRRERLASDGGPSVSGLDLAGELPAMDDGLPVVQFGWRWGKEFVVVQGRLAKGSSAAEIAAKAGVTAPVGASDFLANNVRVEGTTGSPLIGKDGTVLGVSVEVTVPTGTAAVVIPAPAIRTALLSTVP